MGPLYWENFFCSFYAVAKNVKYCTDDNFCKYYTHNTVLCCYCYGTVQCTVQYCTVLYCTDRTNTVDTVDG